MNNILSRLTVQPRVATIFVAILLVATLLASLAAGPDEPKASNMNENWEVFEGHAYADNRAAPAGVSLIACLGGCENGYQTAPVITGEDGIYEVKVEPGALRPAGRMVTFWLIRDADRVEADQDVLFRGQGETRVLDLNFVDLPSAVARSASRSASESATAVESATAAGATAESGPATDSDSGAPTGSASTAGGVTTDLTIPSANDLGLLPAGSPQAYVNSVSYGGMPLLPGFVMVLGLLLALIGVSLLVYRRRLTWR